MNKKVSNKKIATLVAFIVSLSLSCSAVELTITNGIADILHSNKICLRLSLGQNDQAIFCNSLNFSVDLPDIAVKSWTCNQNPSIQYVANFKRVKKVYTDSLACELILDFDKTDKKTMLKNLSDSNLYVSCIVLNKNGTSYPQSLLKPIDDGFSLVDTMALSNTLRSTTSFDLIKTFTAVYSGIKDSTVSIAVDRKPLITPAKPTPEAVNVLIDNLKDIWGILIDRLKSFFMSLQYIYLYLITLILMLLLLFRRFRRQTKPGETEFRRSLVMLWILWTYSFFSFIIPPHIFFTSFAALLAPISLYYIFTARTESTLDKLKSFIGFALAMSILPLLIKAYLSFIFF